MILIDDLDHDLNRFKLVDLNRKSYPPCFNYTLLVKSYRRCRSSMKLTFLKNRRSVFSCLEIIVICYIPTLIILCARGLICMGIILGHLVNTDMLMLEPN